LETSIVQDHPGWWIASHIQNFSPPEITTKVVVVNTPMSLAVDCRDLKCEFENRDSQYPRGVQSI
jgi:hypothetical protein